VVARSGCVRSRGSRWYPRHLVTLDIPLVVALGNLTLLERVASARFAALASEREYSNDEQIDDALRSVLFRVPKPGVTDREPASCRC
jgi:hypothetical protein